MGATNTFITPSAGAENASHLPSGEISGAPRSGLPNSTLRGIRSVRGWPCGVGVRVGAAAVTPGLGATATVAGGVAPGVAGVDDFGDEEPQAAEIRPSVRNARV